MEHWVGLVILCHTLIKLMFHSKADFSLELNVPKELLRL